MKHDIVMGGGGGGGGLKLSCGCRYSHLSLSLLCSVGTAPSGECMVKMRWRDHVVVVTPAQVRGMLVCEETPPTPVPSSSSSSSSSCSEREEEEVIVYHSLGNDRSSHMIVTADGPPQVGSINCLPEQCLENTVSCI